MLARQTFIVSFINGPGIETFPSIQHVQPDQFVTSWDGIRHVIKQNGQMIVPISAVEQLTINLKGQS